MIATPDMFVTENIANSKWSLRIENNRLKSKNKRLRKDNKELRQQLKQTVKAIKDLEKYTAFANKVEESFELRGEQNA